MIVVACAIALATASAIGQSSAIGTAKTDDSQIIDDFEARVSHYLVERKKQVGTSPRSTTSPEKLDQSQQAWGRKAA